MSPYGMTEKQIRNLSLELSLKLKIDQEKILDALNQLTREEVQ